MTRSHGPTLVTGEEIEQNFADALNLLRSVRRTLSRLLDDVYDNPGLLKDVGLKQAELESALKRAFEAEEKYNAWHAKNAGPVHPPACEIDFAGLRDEIACRLARIRTCVGEG